MTEESGIDSRKSLLLALCGVLLVLDWFWWAEVGDGEAEFGV